MSVDKMMRPGATCLRLVSSSFCHSIAVLPSSRKECHGYRLLKGFAPINGCTESALLFRVAIQVHQQRIPSPSLREISTLLNWLQNVGKIIPGFLFLYCRMRQRWETFVWSPSKSSLSFPCCWWWSIFPEARGYRIRYSFPAIQKVSGLPRPPPSSAPLLQGFGGRVDDLPARSSITESWPWNIFRVSAWLVSAVYRFAVDNERKICGLSRTQTILRWYELYFRPIIWLAVRRIPISEFTLHEWLIGLPSVADGRSDRFYLTGQWWSVCVLWNISMTSYSATESSSRPSNGATHLWGGHVYHWGTNSTTVDSPLFNSWVFFATWPFKELPEASAIYSSCKRYGPFD